MRRRRRSDEEERQQQGVTTKSGRRWSLVDAPYTTTCTHYS